MSEIKKCGNGKESGRSDLKMGQHFDFVRFLGAHNLASDLLGAAKT